MKKLLTLALALLPGLAWGQGAIRQNGVVTPGDLGVFIQDRVMESAAKILTDNKRGVNPTTFFDSGAGCGVGTHNALTTGPYNMLCLGHDVFGNAEIIVQNFNGATGGFAVVVNGVTYPFPGSVTGLPTVATTAALKLTPTTLGALVARQDFSSGFGAPTTWYEPGTVPCSLNGGAGDDGSQISSSDGKCWKLRPQQSYDIRTWGLASNPITLYVAIAGNDTVGGATNFCVLSGDPCRTLNHAAEIANKFNVAGGHVIVSMGAGTWNESVSQTSPLLGGGNNLPNPLNLTTLGPSVLLFKGAGSGSTTWNGGPSYCYTAQASNGGAIGIQNLGIQSTGNSCQLSLASQMGGQAFSYGGIAWKASNNQHIHCEDSGSAIYLMGADTLTGGSTNFIGASANCFVLAFGAPLAWSVTLNPGLTFTNFVRLDNNATLNDSNQSNASHFGAGSTITGQPFLATGNSVFANQTGVAFGSLLPTGSLISYLRSGGRVNPAPPSTVSGASGLGSTGTISILSQGPRSGIVTLSPSGAGIAAVGGFNIALGIGLISDGGGTAVCTATGNQSGTGAWSSPAAFYPGVFTIAGSNYSLTLNWANSAALTAGSTYLINYVCQEGS